ncbi:MAG: ATP-binding cassette domain-containing protein [Deltaproteobacteria bacterium]|nr:ATP-binding cassette domain-containing protein [Deltaproteobacteria bacterium]
MALVTLQNVSLGFGGALLLDSVNLEIENGERVCLVGRNGVGKSTLMKLFAGELQPDSGRILTGRGLRVARLSQEVPGFLEGTVYDVVVGGLGGLLQLLARYHMATLNVADKVDDVALEELAEIEKEIEIAGAWQVQRRVDLVMSQLKLDSEHPFATLSGGLKRRVMLARALVTEPHLLLLDEPTNHLDIDAIVWLEEFFLGSSLTLLFVTHDREFLKKLATRIIDLDGGRAVSWPGDYSNYLRRKEEMLNAQTHQNERFDQKLAREEEWIRKGIKARRTRNEGRVRDLLKMRSQRLERREKIGQVKMEISKAGISGKLVAVCKEVSFAYDGKPVIANLTTTILKGDKVGIIGPNGSGKTTLLKILLGELKPTAGTVRLGSNLEPLYFDQQREQLDENRTVFENLGDGNDTLEINGRRRHLIGYLKDFLFTPERAHSPVRILSGGERNRLLLARLFARPANILVLDEPTNDLDLETLELLEKLLADYQGTLLLVSHDREFINNVVTSTLVFAENGEVQEYAGGYDDWLMQRPAAGPLPELELKNSNRKKEKPRSQKPRKLTFKEKAELDSLPANLELLEKEQQQLYQDMADPAFYQGDAGAVPKAKNRLAEIDNELQKLYARWEELEMVQEDGG